MEVEDGMRIRKSKFLVYEEYLAPEQLYLMHAQDSAERRAFREQVVFFTCMFMAVGITSVLISSIN